MIKPDNVELMRASCGNGKYVKQKNQGIALVLVLGAVVMITILIVAFFSRALLNRQISTSSTNLVKSDQIARSALDVLVGELREEIRNGSTTATVSGVTIYTPNSATSMVPVRDSAVPTEANVIRTSSSSPLAGSSATAVASSVPSSTPSLNKRSVSSSAWDKIRLCAASMLPENAPKWILLTRTGSNTDTALTVAQAADRNNPNFVLGRYSYVIYNEGGLLNINVAGAPSTVGAIEKGTKGAAVFADLTVLGLTTPQSDALVAWRNAAGAGTYADTIFGSGGAADNGFSRIPATDKTFLNRQALLKYAKANGFDLAPSTTPLKYLATSTFEKNSPSFAPATPSALNPDFKKLISPLTGSPVQRFPLSRFRLLDQNPAALSTQDAEDILKYFGLSPVPGASNTYRAWSYRGSTIGTPDAAITDDRDPDLFELVKAAIVNGSLGVLAANSNNSSCQIYDSGGGATYSPETNVHHQVARIIANMIDQYDADSYPTTIVLGSNPASDPCVYGIESLPYFSMLMFKAHYPSGTFTNATNASLRFYFELWNPHQSVAAGSLPSNVRIVVNPEAKYSCNLNHTSPTPSSAQEIWGGPSNAAKRTFPPAYLASGGGIDIGSVSGYTTPARMGTPMTLDTPGAAPAIYGAGSNYVNLRTSNIVFSLQFKDAANNWHTYSSFAGMDNDGGATGIQDTGVFTYNPFTDPDVTDKHQYSSTIYKSDPRTFRYRMGTSGDFSTLAVRGNSDVNEQQYTEKAPSHFAKPTFPIMLYKNNTPSVGSYLIQLATDADGTARVGDGYLGSDGTTNPISQPDARPVILNRPFRSVGELGYVFRDSPWKSLNFFSSDSGDAGLLDLFSLEEGGVVAGKTNLNSLFSPKSSAQSQTILKAMVGGALRTEGSAASAISNGDRDQLVSDFAGVEGSLMSLSEVMTKFSSYTSNAVNSQNLSKFKTQREMAIRALSSGTQVRTWNLLIDLVAQAGRYPINATAWDKFLVESERHYWFHVAIDRFTGEVLKTQLENVDD